MLNHVQMDRSLGPIDPQGRTADRFWRIPTSGWWAIIKRTWSEKSEDNLSQLAAAVAFYSFLAFVPLLAAVVLLYGIFADPNSVARHIHTLMEILPAGPAMIVADQLKALTETPVSRTTVGLILAIALALYGAMRGATSLISALNIVYGEHEKRSFARTTGLSFAFTLGAVVVAIIASVAIGALGFIGGLIQLPEIVGSIVTVGLWIATAFLASGLVAVLYRYGPDRADARWTWLAPGSMFASLGALLATFLFGLYVSHFGAYNATYGALGAVVSFLMWLYVTAFVVLLGAELNAEIEHQTSRDTTTGPSAPEGQRGAAMADTTAGMPPMSASAETTPPVDADQSSGGALRPIAAGILAAQITRRLSGKAVGALPLSLFSAGAAMLLRRDGAKKAIACLGVAAFLIWKTRDPRSVDHAGAGKVHRAQ
jgi:membrane protein